MSAKQSRISADETARRGDDIYERIVGPKVESAHHGRVVAIDVVSEEFEFGDSALDASRRLLRRMPEAEIWVVRVGERALHRIGGHSL